MTSADVIARDKAHMVHPWTIFDVFKKEGALPMVRAEGARIYDINGKEYLDAVGGLWCTNIGQGREEMAEAIAEGAVLMNFLGLGQGQLAP